MIFANNAKISANIIQNKNDYSPQSLVFDYDQLNSLSERDNLSSERINDEIQSSNLWPRIHRQSDTSAMPNFDFRRGIVRFYPYKKRTIPLELQKALYAHGIVGRRR
jgi:hypothetical protein